MVARGWQDRRLVTARMLCLIFIRLGGWTPTFSPATTSKLAQQTPEDPSRFLN
jgi:hypothetical protein